MGHVYLGEELWSYLLFDGMSLLVRQPEETVSQPMHHRTSRSFSDSVHLPSPHGAILVDSPCTLPDIFRTPGSLIRFVPPEPVPVSARLALRVHRVTAPPCLPDPPALTSPLLVLALRQQIFLHPSPPHITAGGQLRVLSSEKSLTGQIVVAENLRDGYRLLRRDHSILGGRWIRQVSNGGKTRTDLGDSYVFSKKFWLMKQDLRD